MNEQIDRNLYMYEYIGFRDAGFEFMIQGFVCMYLCIYGRSTCAQGLGIVSFWALRVRASSLGLCRCFNHLGKDKFKTSGGK